MIANLSLYPAYKSSDVEWLGDVPAHWEVVQLDASGDSLKAVEELRRTKSLKASLAYDMGTCIRLTSITFGPAARL